MEIYFKTDNSAFGETYLEKAIESQRILKQIIKDIDRNDIGIIKDINGNTIGSWNLT